MLNDRKSKARRSSIRSSRRIREMSPEERPAHIPYLPTEIISTILRRTKKCDLKSTRLVSKSWDLMSTPFLFDTLYISLRNHDLQVFSNITKHPVLRKAVTNLTWDTSRFHRAWDLRDYFEHLIFNIRFLSGQEIEEPSTPFHTFINDLRKIDLDSDRHYGKYQLEPFVIEGYITWQTLASEEESLLNGGLFYAALSKGLQQLDRIRSVHVSAGLWNRLRDEPWKPMIRGNAFGTPLMRSWDPRFAPPSDEVSRSKATTEFVLLTMALDNSASDIKMLEFYQDSMLGGLELYTLNEFPQLNQLCGPAVSAYRNLTSFQIKLRISDIDEFQSSKLVQLLPTLLRSMSKLKELSIDMDSWQQIPKTVPPNSYDYRLIIPQAGQWPYMTHFKLFGADMGGFDLFKLLKAGMPRLRHLDLNAMNLSDWNWDGMFEGLRYLKGLQTIRLPSKQGHLQHRGGRYYPHGPENLHWGHNHSCEFFSNMEDYVISGGRHPSLTPDSESRDADRFLDEFLARFEISEKCSRQDEIARYKRIWRISDDVGIANIEYAMGGGI